MKKRTNINISLRMKRAEQITKFGGYPITIRIKPTSHKQYCYNCRRLIEKEELQVIMPDGLWIKYKGDHCKSLHMANSGIHLGGHQIGTRVFQRKVYLHTHCFGCVTKKLFAKAGTSLIPDCEKCKERFNCYTGNTEDLNRFPYMPSRQPQNDDDDEGFIQ